MTTQHPNVQTRQQHAVITSPTRTVPDSHGRATDLHDIDTDEHGPTMHLHGPGIYMSPTRTSTASIRTKHDLRPTDKNLYKSRLMSGDSIIMQSNLEGVISYTNLKRQKPP
ncbi:hypothetical protein DPMN_019993 [Dreissena polymorpha]|uniref:Uncharacterized protein n=1 Tax=Dreissena polymorpha TaxID=45954 RepID=A0A9D4NKA3_DREPO|nr:hypothetical protein DPMN_019993 [Dreissena polymorpha]